MKSQRSEKGALPEGCILFPTGFIMGLYHGPDNQLKFGLFRGQKGGDFVSTFSARHSFDFRHLSQRFDNPVDQIQARLHVGHLSALELDGDLDLVLVRQEFSSMFQFELEIVFIDTRADTNFLQHMLMGFRLAGLTVLLVFELAIIHDSANRRTLRRSDLHEIELLLPSQGNCFIARDNAQHLAIPVNDAKGADADLLVDPRSLLLLWLTVERH